MIPNTRLNLGDPVNQSTALGRKIKDGSWYKVLPNGSWVDICRNQPDALLAGGSGIAPDAHEGGYGSLALDGDGYANAAAVDFGLDFQEQVSFGCWFRTTDTSGRLVHKEIVDGYNTILCAVSSSSILFAVQNNSSDKYPQWATVGTYADGLWHHAFFTFSVNAGDATDGIVYIDGVPVSTTYGANDYSVGFTLHESNNNLLFGMRPITFADPFAGNMDDVMVFPRMLLSADEVSEICSDTQRPQPTLLNWIRPRWDFVAPAASGNRIRRIICSSKG